MLIDSKELWEKGGYGKDNPLDRSIAYVKKIGSDNSVDSSVIDTIIAETFIGLANGDTYPTDKCPCGCGSNKSGTAIVHHMVARVLEEGEKVKVEQAKIVEANLNTMILNHISKQNEEYTKKEMTIKPFLNWNRSETIRAARWIKNGLVRNSK